MRILRVHNRYQQRGGEDVSFDAEVQLLRDYGANVSSLVFSNDDIPAHRSPIESARLAATTIWSTSGRRRVVEAIAASGADIVHFDNIHPLISPAAYSAARGQGAAVVQTLHNFRLICPNGYLFRDNHPCEDCLGKPVPLPGVIHACYRQSRPQTAIVAAMLVTHSILGTWSRDIDRYIALNEFSRGKFIDGGVPADRIVVKPNFVKLPEMSTPAGARDGFLYAGRLSPEKGIHALLTAWRDHRDLPPITIFGNGPVRASAELVAARNPALILRGPVSRDEVLDRLRSAYALVFPSGCYENFPVAVIEAFACGVPVIAAGHGAMAQIVTEGTTGLLFRPGDPEDLATKVRWAWEHPGAMRHLGEQARLDYEENYTPERNVGLLMDIYQQALEHRHGLDHRAAGGS